MPSYERLSNDEEATFFLPKSRDPLPATWPWITSVSLSINVIVAVVALVLLIRPIHVSHYSVYSPAQAVISDSAEVPVVFHHSWTTSPTKYRGVGVEVDKAWHELYGAGPSIITEDDAKKLPNASEPLIIGGQPMYSTYLAVFHDLHCLNLLRMANHPDHYNSSAIKELASGHHLDHCIDMLRQTIQCRADITPLPLKFGPNEGELLLTYRSDVKRVCRDFDKVKEWAYSRKGTEEFSKVLHIKGPSDN